jgi:asparagine synthase (glutamine-hydrolysing)
VRKRMLAERPVAALLSGGVDSSLIASLVAKELRLIGARPLKTFSIGMKGSQDLKYARKVADWIGSDHHEIVLGPNDFLRVIPEVIQTIESFDTTTVRASVGNWLVAREVAKQSDCKVVFNGDGSDEVFGSYLYFYNAPHDSAYEEEASRLLGEIHYFDVLRSDRTISCHGLEPRTPFLDKQFVSVARSIATEWLRPQKNGLCEKWLLRRAFDDGVTLPHEVLWRRKEAFSDGVSPTEKSWSQLIAEYVEDFVPEGWKELAEQKYPNMTPKTAEQFFYRFHFEANYGKASSHTVIPQFWMPKWSPGVTDPSARALAIY